MRLLVRCKRVLLKQNMIAGKKRLLDVPSVGLLICGALLLATFQRLTRAKFQGHLPSVVDVKKNANYGQEGVVLQGDWVLSHPTREGHIVEYCGNLPQYRNQVYVAGVNE